MADKQDIVDFDDCVVLRPKKKVGKVEKNNREIDNPVLLVKTKIINQCQKQKVLISKTTEDSNNKLKTNTSEFEYYSKISKRFPLHPSITRKSQIDYNTNVSHVQQVIADFSINDRIRLTQPSQNKDPNEI